MVLDEAALGNVPKLAEDLAELLFSDLERQVSDVSGVEFGTRTAGRIRSRRGGRGIGRGTNATINVRDRI